MKKQQLENIEYYKQYRKDPWSGPDIAHRDCFGYLMRCVTHHKLSCTDCEQATGVTWERAVPGCDLDQTTDMNEAAILEGFRLNGDYGDWGLVGRLRKLWLRDLQFVLTNGDLFDTPKERVQYLQDEILATADRKKLNTRK